MEVKSTKTGCVVLMTVGRALCARLVSFTACESAASAAPAWSRVKSCYAGASDAIVRGAEKGDACHAPLSALARIHNGRENWCAYALIIILSTVLHRNTLLTII
eukprot:2129102-Pleurochrysis_carterae.AAC.1